MAENIKIIQHFSVDKLSVTILENRNDMGRLSSTDVADKLRQIIQEQGSARMIFAAAPSQNEFLQELCRAKGIDWSRVTAFHLDDYIGLGDHAPQRFSNYLKAHLFERVPFGQIHFLIDPDSSLSRRLPLKVVAADIAKVCHSYTELLNEAPIDIVCMGIGENGHIAFNDPPVADFRDPQLVKLVQLEDNCRLQQVHDGCFTNLEEVPTHALTLTIPALVAARWLYCIVPGPTKCRAVQKALQGEITTECPASILRNHPHANLYLDLESASGLSSTSDN